MPQDHSPSEIAAPRRPDRPSAPPPRGYLFDDRLYRSLRALGLSVRLEFDVEEWKDFIRGTEWPVVNAIADPAYHDFAAGEVFWLRLSHGGEVVATQVFRMIMTGDYVAAVRDHSLFFGDHPSAFRDFRMLADDRIPLISGLVVQLSGLYIRPTWRRVRTADGLRLVAAWARLSHSFAARNLMADWSVSIAEARVTSARMIEELYGYPHWGHLFETYEPALGRFERISLMWMSAEELAGSAVSRPRPADRSDHREPSTVE